MKTTFRMIINEVGWGRFLLSAFLLACVSMVVNSLH
jgi:hypothetical protein